MKELSFLVPLYNEEENIVATVATIIRASKDFSLDFEIILVDDKSSDRSFDVALELSSIYPQIKVYRNDLNLGFAKTYFKCLEKSNSKYVMYISSDNDIDYENLKQLLNNIGKAPIVLQYCLNFKNRNYYRHLISRFYTVILNFLNKKDLKYYNGFNIYESRLVKGLKISESSFAFQSEIVSQLIRDNAFVQVPINCHYHDERSNALKFRNVVGVIQFLFTRIVQYLRKI